MADIHANESRRAMPWIWIRRHIIRQKSLVNADEGGLLYQLPIELVQYIATFLPDSSAAALALCSCRMLYTLGIQSQNFKLCPNILRKRDALKEVRGRWTKLITISRHTERDNLLSLLERDLPDLTFCRCCSLLHPPDLLGQLHATESARRGRLCFHVEKCAWFWQLIPGDHTFLAMQAMMNRHRAGLDCTAALHRFHEGSTGRSNERTISEARIVSDNLLIKVQTYFLLPTGHGFLSGRRVRLCFHWHFAPYTHLYTGLERKLSCEMHHPGGEHLCPTCSGFESCPFCYTEMQINRQDFANGECEIAITRWMDLGTLQSLLDPKWLARVDNQLHIRSPRFPRVHYESGSIMKAFEGTESFVFKSAFAHART
jgi:hypothetical protein